MEVLIDIDEAALRFTMRVKPAPGVVGVALVAGALLVIASIRGVAIAAAISVVLTLLLFPLVVFASRNPRKFSPALVGGVIWTGSAILAAAYGPRVISDVFNVFH